MASFLQLHILTSYPPSNLNRDDMGSPKSAIVGGTNRTRIASQSLKRAWRTSDVFAHAVAAKGIRTKELGSQIVYPKLLAAGVDEKLALKVATSIAGVFGKNKSDKKDAKDALNIEQIAFISPEELAAIDALIDKVAEEKAEPSAKELELLRKSTSAADLALFGRMLASKPEFNIEAAAQVAHAFTVHAAQAQDDFFTAVDDLSSGREDAGASHLGEREFSAGLYYVYICINADLLRENLTVAGDANVAQELSRRAMRGLTEAALTIAPRGMQNSFASRARASYALAEIGSAQPRSLSVAFLKAIKGEDFLQQAITALTTIQTNMDTVYGSCADKRYTLDTTKPEGSLQDILTFVEGA
jgi:CRISPR system Cascade subunit CasC